MHLSPEQMQGHMQKWMEWMENLKKQERFLGAQPLANTGKTIAGPGKLISDGPFMESKEMVGGYLLCLANDYDEAVDISKGCPILEFEDGKVEVREVMEM
jgi:hypothetical protein